MKKELDYKFKGWDYTELYPYLEIDDDEPTITVDDEDNDDLYESHQNMLFERAKDYIETTAYMLSYERKNLSEQEKERIDRVEKACREFVKSLIEQDHTTNTPLWEGLIKCESFTFLRYCSILLGHLWD